MSFFLFNDVTGKVIMQTILIKDDEWREGFGKKLFSLQQTGQFCDVIIKTVEDARLLVHSCVLAAASPLLKGVIESALSDSSLGTIMLSSDIDVNTWTHMLEFMYMGNSEVDANLVPSLLSGASILKIDTLVDRCNEVISVKPVEEEAATELYSAIAQIKEDTDQVIDAPNQAIVVPDQTMAIPDQTMSVSEENVDQQEQNIDAHNPEIDTNDQEMDAQDYIDDVQDTITVDCNTAAAGADPPTLQLDNSLVWYREASQHLKPTIITDGNIQQQHAEEVNEEQLKTDYSNENSNDEPLDFALKFPSKEETSEIIVKGTKFKFIRFNSKGKKEFKCGACGKISLHPVTHSSVHSEERPYICGFKGCFKAYKGKEALKCHVGSVHAPSTYRCVKCGKSYKTRHLLQKHVAVTCSEKKPYICQVCNKAFKSKGNLKYHEGVHVVEKRYTCDVCGKKCATKFHLRDHLNVHQKDPYTCFCGRSYKHEKSYKEHFRIVHDRNNPFVCDICEKTFKNKKALDAHIKTHSLPYSCKICKKGFRNAINCQLHEKNKHNTAVIFESETRESRQFKCSKCDKIYKSEFTLKQHMESHIQSSIPCPKCSRTFVSKRTLKYHLEHHSKPYACQVCGARFALASYVIKHQKSHSDGKSPSIFMCTFCSTECETLDDLNKHIKTEHPDEKTITIGTVAFREKGATKVQRSAYVCHYCKEKFSSITEVRGHVHEKKCYVSGNEFSAQDIFNCELCPSLFSNEKSLINHELKDHNNEGLRISCKECNIQFVTDRTLRKHLYLDHQQGEWHHCTECKREFYLQNDLEQHYIHAHSMEYQDIAPKSNLISVTKDEKNIAVGTDFNPGKKGKTAGGYKLLLSTFFS